MKMTIYSLFLCLEISACSSKFQSYLKVGTKKPNQKKGSFQEVTISDFFHETNPDPSSCLLLLCEEVSFVLVSFHLILML